MADLPEFSPELSPEERAFLQQVRQWVKDDNQTIDFDTLRQKTPTDNKGIFWLSFACELCTLPPSGSLDIRENGRLSVALRILYALLESNRHFPEVWAQRLIALNYWVAGREAFAGALATAGETERANEVFADAHKAKNELYSTLENALALFPDDEWFADFRDNHLPDDNVELKDAEAEPVITVSKD